MCASVFASLFVVRYGFFLLSSMDKKRKRVWFISLAPAMAPITFLGVAGILNIWLIDVNEYSMFWLCRDIFPGNVRLYVHNDALAALASGTMGKLHGCVLIAGTGTIAYGFTEDGRDARAAGAGPILGDWGRYLLVAQNDFFSFLTTF